MATIKIYLLEFPESFDGHRTFIAAHSPFEVEGRNKKGESTGGHTAISSECKSFMELEEQILWIERDLKAIRKEGRKYFKR